MTLDFNDIRKLLPQQFPIIMVDRVLEFEKGKSLKAVKSVSGNEIHFLGHFPHVAIMPGVLILEGMAQSALLLVQLTYGALPQDEVPLYGSVNAKFHKVVIPGDQLVYEVEVVKLTSYAGLFKAEAKVGSEVVARAELGLGGRRKGQPGGESAGETENRRRADTPVTA